MSHWRCSGDYVGRHPGGVAHVPCFFETTCASSAVSHFERTGHAVDACAQPYYLPLHVDDRQLRALAMRSLAALERANDRTLSAPAFRRALRAHRRAVGRYQRMALRHKGVQALARAILAGNASECLRAS